MARRLTRAQDGRPQAPVRMLHLGMGNFFRAHVAMYTEQSPDAGQWGIAAFTGRSVGIVPTLHEQDDLYTLIVQNPGGNEYQVIGSLSAVHAGSDVDAWLRYCASPDVTVITSTITEAGYLPAPGGGLATDAPGVAADVDALRGGAWAEVTTAPGKFVAGLLARRAAGAGAITFCPCDNVPDNGRMVARIVGDLAALVDPDLPAWIATHVSFATTMVDRITPATPQAARDALAVDEGVDDPVAVATEPFTEWVIAGDFPGGRPAWEAAGVTFVDDITVHEMRKLWLLNGSHSLMAYAATLIGHETVYEAISDPLVSGWVNAWWDVAARHLPLPAQDVADYRAALLERFGNPRMHDQLARIAADGSVKIPIRIVAALNADRAAGGTPIGAERAVAAWILHLRGLGASFNDAHGDAIKALAAGTLDQAVAAVCDHLGIPDAGARASILELAQDLQARVV